MYTFKLKHSNNPIYREGTATIVLSEYSKDKDEEFCITPNCRSQKELRAEVGRLKGELDAILQQSASKFME